MEDEFYYKEGDITLDDVDSFISKLKTIMLQELPDKEVRLYIGIDDKKCFQLWFKDNEDNMYMVKPELVNQPKIDDMDDKEELK